MYLYVELWKARPEWLKLSQQERAEYIPQAGQMIQELLKVGLELVGFALNDSETPHRADYSYLAVWKMPDKEIAHQLEEAVERSGWHRYFEQVNVRGEFVTLENLFGNIVHNPSTIVEAV